MFTGAAAPADKVINHQSTVGEGEQDGEQESGGPASLAYSPPPPEEPVVSTAIETRPSTLPTPVIHPNLQSLAFAELHHPLFEVEQLGADRRLLVNRKRQLKMYRVWMQGKFRKLQGSTQ